MRIKKKLRRAFDRSAPDGLGRILQEIPARQAAPVTRRVTTAERKKHWIKEFAATAAAFALLVSIIGGTVWYFGHAGGPGTGATNPSSPTGDPGLTQPSVTDPIEPRPEVYVEDLDYMAENILYPWYLRDSIYAEPEVKTPVSSVCSEDVYALTKVMGSYTYEFHFDTWNGELLAILITDYANTVAEFIPETVAQAIALLNEDYKNLTAHSQLVKTGSSGYYAVTLIGVAEEWPAKAYYIHAQTGELLELGAEVEPGYTVGPQPSVDTTPPDGMLDADIAIQIAMKYAGVEECASFCVLDDGLKSYHVTLDDGKYLYEITVHAYSGEILAAPTPVLKENVDIPPDGRISMDMAIDASLEFLGITREQAENLTCTDETDRFRITLDYQDTHFVFTVQAYNPTNITCEKYEATGATKEIARNYALDYLGMGMEYVSFLRIEQDLGGEHDNPGFLIWIVYEGVEYQLSLDHYGQVLTCEKLDVGKNPDENRTDIIGWRAARDIYMADKGMTLDEMTEFSCQFISEEGCEEYYDICINGNAATIVAKSGEYFYEGDGDGPVVYTKAILTADEITEIVMRDVDPQIREKYAAGAYSEAGIYTQVLYKSGVREGENRLYYEWFLFADGIYLTYHVDAFTGEIFYSQGDIAQ